MQSAPKAVAFKVKGFFRGIGDCDSAPKAVAFNVKGFLRGYVGGPRLYS